MEDPQLGERANQLLVAACNAEDLNLRRRAQEELEAWETNSTPEFLVALVQVLCDNNREPAVRNLSGIMLKNAVYSDIDAKRRNLQARWQAVEKAMRQFIRSRTLTALIGGSMDYTNTTLRSLIRQIAQFLAKIAVMDIFGEEGCDIILVLRTTVLDPSKIGTSTKPALLAIEYISEDLVQLDQDLNNAQTHINHILEALVIAMECNADIEVKILGTKAFYHAVVLAENNFRTKEFRDRFVQIITQNCGSDNQPLQVAAFECLVQIAEYYYEYLADYIRPFAVLTYNALRDESKIDVVGLPAMEFWSSVCEEELKLKETKKSSLNIIHQARNELIPVLVHTMRRHDDDGDTKEWNIAMSAATCLQLTSELVEDDIVDEVVREALNFLRQHSEDSTKESWKYREAAVLSFGSVLRGSSSIKIQPVFPDFFERIVKLLIFDGNDNVRDTAAWTLAEICENHYDLLKACHSDSINILVEIATGTHKPLPEAASRTRGLQDVTRVAVHICSMITALARKQGRPGDTKQTTDLSAKFGQIVPALLAAGNRDDAIEDNLMSAAYNSLALLIGRVGNDQSGSFLELTVLLMLNLKQAIEIGHKDIDVERQALICGCLQTLMPRMAMKWKEAGKEEKKRIEDLQDNLLDMYVLIFRRWLETKSGRVQATLLAVGALCKAVPPERCLVYLNQRDLFKFLTFLLDDHGDVDLCRVCLGFVQDLCSLLGVRFADYAQKTMESLGKLVQASPDRRVFPALLIAFGDIALAIKHDYENYVEFVIKTLEQASAVTIADVGGHENDEAVEYLNDLRDGIIQAYTGIILGFKEIEATNLEQSKRNSERLLREFAAYVRQVMVFIEGIVSDYTKPEYNQLVVSEEVMSKAASLVADLTDAYKLEMVKLLFNNGNVGVQQCVSTLLEFCSSSNDAAARDALTRINDKRNRFSVAA